MTGFNKAGFVSATVPERSAAASVTLKISAGAPCPLRRALASRQQLAGFMLDDPEIGRALVLESDFSVPVYEEGDG